MACFEFYTAAYQGGSLSQEEFNRYTYTETEELIEVPEEDAEQV